MISGRITLTRRVQQLRNLRTAQRGEGETRERWGERWEDGRDIEKRWGGGGEGDGLGWGRGGGGVKDGPPRWASRRLYSLSWRQACQCLHRLGKGTRFLRSVLSARRNVHGRFRCDRERGLDQGVQRLTVLAACWAPTSKHGDHSIRSAHYRWHCKMIRTTFGLGHIQLLHRWRGWSSRNQRKRTWSRGRTHVVHVVPVEALARRARQGGVVWGLCGSQHRPGMVKQLHCGFKVSPDGAQQQESYLPLLWEEKENKMKEKGWLG